MLQEDNSLTYIYIAEITKRHLLHKVFRILQAFFQSPGINVNG